MVEHNKVTLDIQGLFGPTRAAEYLGITRMTLWRWTKSNKIRVIYLEDHPFYPLGELVRVKEKLG